MKKNIIIGVIVIAVVIAVSLLILNRPSNQSNNNSSDLDSIPTIEIEPTEEIPQYSKSDYQILILNGSGVNGAAADLKTDLEELDYTIADVDNADNSNYTKTIIQAKTTVVEGFVDELKADLENNYDSVTIEELEEDNENDVVIIIGGIQETNQTEEDEDQEATENSPTKTETEPSATPTTSPTPTLTTEE